MESEERPAKTFHSDVAAAATSESQVDEPLFSQSQGRDFGLSTCFLCARKLSAENRTDEHVVPQWALDRYDLRKRTLSLLNGTTYRYGQFKIPCCRDCNNVHLSRVESRVAAAFQKGPAAVASLNPWDLHIWLGKIFYGFLHKESLLAQDMKVRDGASIIDPALLGEMDLLHFSLQGARRQFSASAAHPAIGFPLSSLFVFAVKEPPDPSEHFDVRDSLQTMVIQVRMGKVAVIACLADGGVTRAVLEPLVQKIGAHALHPLQLLETFARVLYHSTLLDRVPKWIITEAGPEIHMMQAPMQGLSPRPLHRDWSAQDFAPLLASLTGVPVETLYPNERQVMSWLLGPNEAFADLSFDSQPWPPYVVPSGAE